MGKRRREVYAAAPGNVSDLLAVLVTVSGEYPDAKWDIVDGRMVVTSTKEPTSRAPGAAAGPVAP